MAYQSHPKGCVLVTDAMAALGLPPGRHRLGSLEVEVVADGGNVSDWSTCLPGTCEASCTSDQFRGVEVGNRASSFSSSSSSSSSSSAHRRRSSLGSPSSAKDNRLDCIKKAVLASDQVTLAGSVASMDECVRNYIAFTGCSIVEALEAASLHPARALGIEQHKGTLQPGKDADFIFLNPTTLHVRATFVAGVLCYASTEDWGSRLRFFEEGGESGAKDVQDDRRSSSSSSSSSTNEGGPN